MMKKYFAILTFIFSFFVSNAQNDKYPYPNDYHFIYIELYGAQSKLDIIEKLKDLVEEIKGSNDSIFLFLSNGEKYIKVAKYSEINDNLYNTIFGLQPGLPSYKYDIEKIIDHWNKNDFLYMNKEDIELKYSNVHFHYFVSVTSLKNYWGLIIDRLLKINNIAPNFGNTENLSIKIYVNDDWATDKLEDAQTLINDNLGKDYTIKYITY